MDFSTTLSVQDDRARLSVRGELDAFAALQLRWRADDALALGCRHFTVDLGDLTFVDAGGLGSLVRLLNETHRVDGSVTLVDAGPPFRRPCGLAGLTRAFFEPGRPVHAREAAGTP